MVIIPKCPFYSSAIQWILRLALLALGTIGLLFLNLWVAVIYLIYYLVWFFLIMPLIHCKYCYFKVKEPTTNSLLPKEKWKESCLKMHVAWGKKWAINFFILWFLPIVLIVISLFLSFSIFALLSLIGFIVVLALMLIHMKQKVCPTCAIVEECHAAF